MSVDKSVDWLIPREGSFTVYVLEIIAPKENHGVHFGI